MDGCERSECETVKVFQRSIGRKMYLIDRIELFVRYSLLASTVMFTDTDSMYFRKQIKRIDDILYNDGDFKDIESFRSDESESCSLVEGIIRGYGSDEIEGSGGTGEGDEEVES